MYSKFSILDEKSEKCPRFSKNVYYLSRMLILHIQLYILILSCSLWSETFEICKMSMFVMSVMSKSPKNALASRKMCIIYREC